MLPVFPICTVVLLVLAGCATPGDNYVAIRGGVNQLQDADNEGCCLGEMDFEPGPTASLAVGRAFDNGFSLELEAQASHSEMDTVKMHHTGGHNEVEGTFSTFALMGNAYYTFGHDRDWYVYPYVGVGLGGLIANVDTRSMDCSGTARGSCPEVQRRLADDDQSRGWTNVVPAGQIMVGLTVPVTENVEIFTEGRLLRAFGTPKINGGETDLWFQGGSEWETVRQEALVGLRWSF